MSAIPLDNRETGRRRRPLAAFVSVGPRLIHYDVDVESATLVERDSTVLPANIHYAWPHTSGNYLYVASSNGGPGGTGNNKHHVTALRIDLASGAMRPHGESIALSSRPIHITTDTNSEHALIAYNKPSGLTVHRINRDGTLGVLVKQKVPLEFGIFPHQVRISPSNKVALLVTRGNDAAEDKPEDPGALKVFNYENGILTPQISIAPRGGYGFGPRHLDIHPGQPWLFVSLERQNKLYVFELDENNRVAAEPLFKRETLADPDTIRPRQMAGAVHVHPNGRFVYVANRALGVTEFRGEQVSVGGETGIAVFAVDQRTGEPTKIQNIDVRGAHPRTFAIDPSGKILITANSAPLITREGDNIVNTPAHLAVFRIENNGRLQYLRKFDLTVHNDEIFWMCMMA